MRKILGASLAAILLMWGVTPLGRIAAQQPAGTIAIDTDDIGGIVRSTKGAEAGVWVIAETRDLPTKFARIVVTDDQGRYVLPDLPKATYNVWTRGYGLVDSKPVRATPGQRVNLTAVVAASPRAAAQYYPANYWYSLMEIPPKSAFPMEKEGIKDQLDWISRMKNDIQLVQIGDKATREIPEKLGKFKSSVEAWEAWLAAEPQVNLARLNKDVALKMYANWTDRIAAGEYPKAAPPRPQGVERNAVITMWDWGTEKAFIHDVMVSDVLNPTFNANGLIYGEEQFSSDYMTVLDPNTNTATRMPVPMEDQNMPFNSNRKTTLTWGDENVRPAKMRLHNQAIDPKGRVWMTGKFRGGDNQPAFCKEGSTHPAAKWFPLARNGDLQMQMYEPKTKKFTNINTCYQMHHLMFGNDPDRTIWGGGGGGALGFFKTRVFDETGDVAKAQGWCPYILDTNGNGKVDAGWVEPDQPVDPKRDKRIQGGGYGISTSLTDGSIWLGTAGAPGFILRVQPGPNPPMTCMTEIYNVPRGTSTPKGVFIDTESVVWVGLASSSHFASFDRRKCKVLSGPTATGDQCPEGWTLYPVPGPKFKNVPDAIGTDWYYLNWVDRFDTLGLGKNVPIVPGTNSDSMIALLPSTKTFVTIRVPYPLGFFARGMDGRIDDAKAGWKGKGLWSTYASISPWNVEGGKGTAPKVVKFQIRPDPLAH